MIRSLTRFLFFNLVARPILFLYLGVATRNRQRLPQRGPAIIVANHNSHLDALALLTIFPRRAARYLRPVAAADYFLRNRLLAWFSLNVIGIIPLSRRPGRSGGDPLEACSEALQRGEVLILFPEGSRGEAERMSPLKSGVAHLVERHPATPIIPVFLHGLGKALPRGQFVLVPFQCTAIVGEALYWTGQRDSFMQSLQAALQRLAEEGQFPAWD
ncbi:MAG: 1-acyl-sn-glycerol-3-phosphate acyltransferase [Leptospirales bacterium]|nr:1-acyl-sn-glycerol-3-phosphate acyltransferase [Leptospirales bacterium]